MNRRIPVALAVNSKTQRCTQIFSKATFEELCNDFDKYKVDYDATNWNGSDDIERTISFLPNCRIGRKHTQYIKVNGTDDDMGHSYSWSNDFDTIIELIYEEKKGKAVLIFDKMPKSCSECRLIDDNGDYIECLPLSFHAGYNFNYREKRMKNCPLKYLDEVKNYD